MHVQPFVKRKCKFMPELVSRIEELLIYMTEADMFSFAIHQKTVIRAIVATL